MKKIMLKTIVVVLAFYATSLFAAVNCVKNDNCSQDQLNKLNHSVWTHIRIKIVDNNYPLSGKVSYSLSHGIWSDGSAPPSDSNNDFNAIKGESYTLESSGFMTGAEGKATITNIVSDDGINFGNSSITFTAKSPFAGDKKCKFHIDNDSSVDYKLSDLISISAYDNDKCEFTITKNHYVTQIRNESDKVMMFMGDYGKEYLQPAPERPNQKKLPRAVDNLPITFYYPGGGKESFTLNSNCTTNWPEKVTVARYIFQNETCVIKEIKGA